MMQQSFMELSGEELRKTEGGLVGGAVLGVLNGACIGLAVSLVGGICNPDWEYEDTMNMMKTGAIVGAYAGAYSPL
jgi:hypothetical protein